MRYLDEALYEYAKEGRYPFHMPGHKRNFHNGNLENPYGVDITEITGFDNLHHAEGILKENQELAAEIYGAKNTYFLVNGSTAGILAAISACTKPGGVLLMARNCHKAAYHGAALRGLKTKYLYPSYEKKTGLNGGIGPEQVERALCRDSGIQAVLLTSPTYDGMVSDIEEIARIVHSFGLPLIVDEAHGAHFLFHPYFPQSALEKGADIVIQSLHKTLPSLTQTGLLHICSRRVSRERVESFLGIYQTSSPSYVLMGSIAACLRYLKTEGRRDFETYTQRLDQCRRKLESLKLLTLIGEEVKGGNSQVFDLDKSKLVISTAKAPIDGPDLHRRLRERYGLELEMEAPEYVLALTSVMDSCQGFQRLSGALLEIDRAMAEEEKKRDTAFQSLDKEEEKTASLADFAAFPAAEENLDACTMEAALEGEKELIPLERSQGRISSEFAYLYPPGIPLLVPGERISTRFINQAESWKKRGIYLQGLWDKKQESIYVLDEIKKQ